MDNLNHSWSHRLAAVLKALPMIAVAMGCSATDDEGRMTVYPTSGRVVVNGAPAAGARVVLYGATEELSGKGTIPPEGITDENGVFHLQSYEPGDGAPAGKFNVTVIWMEPPPEGVDLTSYQPKDRLKGRYSDPESSGLTVEVPEGGGELPPFELKT